MDYNTLFLIVGLVMGGALGTALTWLIIKIRRSYEPAKAESERVALYERLRGRETEILQLQNFLRGKDSEIAGLRQANQNLSTELARIGTRLQDEQKVAGEKLALLDEAQQKLLDAFKALSAQALQNNNQSFLYLAQATLEKFNAGAKNDLDKRQQAISELVRPVQDSLVRFDSKVQQLENARVGAYSALHEQIQQLRTTQDQLRSETSNLVNALRTPNVRGRWGEIQLKRVVELAGMLDHCDFYEQQSVSTEDGRLRPDLLIHLPGQKRIVVDAKAPLDAYLDALQTEDNSTRKAKLRDHARQIRNHITSLGKKAYWNQFQPSPEFVILFLPGEIFFSAALEEDPALIEVGANEQVILATPTTMIALLRTVVYGWGQESIAQNAREIAELGKELYERIVKVSDHWRKLGKNLSSAIEAYNEATGSLESRVLVSARKFRDLETTGLGKEIEELSPIDRIPRELQMPEPSRIAIR